MNNMKRINKINLMVKSALIMALAGMMTFAMVGCDQTNKDKESSTTSESSVVTESSDVESGEDSEVSDVSSDIETSSDLESSTVEEGTTDETQTGTSAASIVLNDIIKDATDPEMMLMETAVTDDNFSWYFFIDPITDYKAAASEAAISSIAHSVAILEVPDGEDVQAIADQIETNLNPRKWVCVEPEATAVKVNGNFILVTMSEQSVVDTVVERFTSMDIEATLANSDDTTSTDGASETSSEVSETSSGVSESSSGVSESSTTSIEAEG